MDGVARTLLGTGSACVAALACALEAASAAPDCAQGRAVYHDPEAGYELRFSETGTGRFAITLSEAAASFDGFVMWDDVAKRTVAIVTRDCPEGDVTGAELAACTLWQGAVYTVDAQGTIGNLGDSTTAAVPRLLLADFARALSLSSFFDDDPETPLPWDAFEYRECAG